MLTASAQPRNAISSPANGSTGQKPRLAMKPATPKDTKHRLPKNSSAARILSEQCGQISMRCGSGCTDGFSARRWANGTAGDFLFTSEAKVGRSASELFACAGAGRGVRLVWKIGQRFRSQPMLQGRQVLRSPLQRGIDGVRYPACELRPVCLDCALREQ